MLAFASSLKQESSERYCMLSDASRWQVGHCGQSEAEPERYCMLFDAGRWQDGHCGQSKEMHIPMQAGGEPLRAVYTHMYFPDSLIHVSVTIMPFGLLAIAFMSSSFYPHSSCPLAYSQTEFISTSVQSQTQISIGLLARCAFTNATSHQHALHSPVQFLLYIVS